MLQLPRYCYSCGAYLMGGATEHKPGCEILWLIYKALREARGEEPPPPPEKKEP